MTFLAESIVCPHCGERYRIDTKKNKAGDTVRRGLCPATPAAGTNPPWATEWELVGRPAPAPA